MPDPSVKMNFFGNQADAERAIVALEHKYDKLQGKMKQTAATSRRTSSKGSQALNNMASSAVALAGQYVGIAAAVGTITKGYSEWAGQIEKATQQSDKFNASLLQGLAFSGDLPQGPDVKKFLQNVPGVTEDKAKAAFLGVAGGAPSLDLNKRKAITNEVSRLAPVLDNSQLTSFGTFAGRLGLIDQDKSANDLADLALKTQADAGARADQVNTPGFQRAVSQLKGKGATTERSLAIGLEAVEKGIRPSSIASIATKLPEGTSLGELAADPRQARRTLGAENAARLSLLDFDRIAQQEAAFRDAQGGKFGGQLGRNVQQAIKTDGGSFLKENVAAQEERKFRESGEQASDLDLLQRRTTNKSSGFGRAYNVGLDYFEGFFDKFRDIDRSGTVEGIAKGNAIVNAKEIEAQNKLLERQQAALEQIAENTKKTADGNQNKTPNRNANGE